MKTILILLLLAALAVLNEFELAGVGLTLAAVVLLIGDLVELPESACTHNCAQSDRCTCRQPQRPADPA